MNQLRIGQQAPEFKVVDLFENPISLKDFQGRKVLISLFRDASCPFCNLQVRKLARAYPEFEKNGIAILAIFHSNKEEIMKYSGKEPLPFPIIPDPGEKLYQLFGLQRSILGKMRSMFKFRKLMEIMGEGLFNLRSMNQPNTLPADFLINENGAIVLAHYGKDFGDHLDINSALAKT